MPHDVFISFSFRDHETAEYIVDQFQSNYGISCWICSDSVLASTNYKSLIANAITDSKVVVFLQSENSVKSKEVMTEISFAVSDDKIIIPFKLDQSQLSGTILYYLAGVEYIDATVSSLDRSIQYLAHAICKCLGKPILSDKNNPTLMSSKIACTYFFVGRDKLIEDIHASFETNNVVFLYGISGIGKSELARQYWKKHKDYYNTVVFARYDKNLSSLIADDTVFHIDGVNRKTYKNNIQQTDEDYAWEKIYVLKKICDNRTLFIIDNFDNDTKTEPLFDHFAEKAPYKILVTTRTPQNSYKSIPVEALDDDSLKEIFIQNANPYKTIIEKNDPDFEELFRLTNRHTYTLELVAKFMEESYDIDSISEIIDLLKEHGLGFLTDDIKKQLSKIKGKTESTDADKPIQQKLSIFLSHSYKDIDRVRKLRDILEYLECEPLLFYLKCLDDNNAELQTFIKREIEARNIFLYCKSQNSESSSWVQEELSYIRSFDSNRLYVIDIDKNWTHGMIELLQAIINIVQGNQIFVSYSHKDKLLFEKLDTYFSSLGYNVFSASGEFTDEAKLRNKLNEFSKAGIFIPLITSNYLESAWCKKEWDYAIHLNAHVVPVVIRDDEIVNVVEVRDRLENTSWIQVSEELCDNDLDNIFHTVKNVKYANHLNTL